MARVFLNDETYNAATDGAEINGSAGTEQVNVFNGVTGLDLTSSVERVDKPGNIADFTFSSFGNSVTIRDGNGDIVAQISGADGKQLVFGDGSIDVAYDGTTLTVGGETVGGTAAAITPAASEIDATTTSGTANGGGGTTETVDIDNTNTDVTADDAADETFVFADATYTATITDFDPANDSLDFPDTGTGNLGLNNAADDGQAQLTWTDGGSVIDVNIVGLTSSEDVLLTSLANFDIV